MFIDLREREEGGERETSVGSPPSPPPACTLTRDRTCNLLVYGMTLQPTEPPGQGSLDCFLTASIITSLDQVINSIIAKGRQHI